MSKQIWKKPEKWPSMGGQAKKWWDNLSIDEKVIYREKYDRYVIQNLKSKNPTPDTQTTFHMRISQLGARHIYRIWVFKDRNI